MCLCPQVAYLLVYGELPSSKELARWDEALMRHSAVPDAVERAVAALPHDAHFMGIVLVALNALSTVHPEQNPALAGQNIYKSKEMQDKQIVRLIGERPTACLDMLLQCRLHKATPSWQSPRWACCAAACRLRSHRHLPTVGAGHKSFLWHAGKMPAIAAMAYHRASGRNFSQPNQRLSYSENFLYMLDAANKPGYKPNPRCKLALSACAPCQSALMTAAEPLQFSPSEGCFYQGQLQGRPRMRHADYNS